MQEIEGRRLERGADRVLGGVCSGLAGYFSVDPLLVRLAFVLLTAASGAGVLLYLILWFFVPEAGEPPRDRDLAGAGIRSMEADLRRIFGETRSSFAATLQPTPPAPPGSPSAPPPAARAGPAHRAGLWLGTLLIVAGAVLLAGSAGLLSWWDWTVMWPALVIGLGLLLLARRLS